MLGYDLYSSALANILTEPQIAMPITGTVEVFIKSIWNELILKIFWYISVGLYAKWGSGKSFLLGKLRDEMKAFTQDWQIEPIFENTPLVFMVILHFALFFGVTAWILSYLTIGLGTSSTIVAVITGSAVVLLSYALFMSLWKFNQINFVTFQDLKVSSESDFTQNLQWLLYYLFHSFRIFWRTNSIIWNWSFKSFLAIHQVLTILQVLTKETFTLWGCFSRILPEL